MRGGGLVGSEGHWPREEASSLGTCPKGNSLRESLLPSAQHVPEEDSLGPCPFAFPALRSFEKPTAAAALELDPCTLPARQTLSSRWRKTVLSHQMAVFTSMHWVTSFIYGRPRGGTGRPKEPGGWPGEGGDPRPRWVSRAHLHSPFHPNPTSGLWLENHPHSPLAWPSEDMHTKDLRQEERGWC